jgi:hypothetical protein
VSDAYEGGSTSKTGALQERWGEGETKHTSPNASLPANCAARLLYSGEVCFLSENSRTQPAHEAASLPTFFPPLPEPPTVPPHRCSSEVNASADETTATLFGISDSAQSLRCCAERSPL